jgi:hypothetical protein
MSGPQRNSDIRVRHARIRELDPVNQLSRLVSAGFDEMDEVSGDGSAELLDDGSIEIEIAYHNADEAVLQGETGEFFNLLSARLHGMWRPLGERDTEQSADGQNGDHDPGFVDGLN